MRSVSHSLAQVQIPSECVYDSCSYFFFFSSDETTLINQSKYIFVSEASRRINYLVDNFVCVLLFVAELMQTTNTKFTERTLGNVFLGVSAT